MLTPRAAQASDEELRNGLIADGYTVLPAADLALPHMDALSAGIDALRAASLPANFLLVYDESWQTASRVAAALEAVTPGLANIHDFFVFDVAPGGVGWGAHRDRAGPGTVGPAAFCHASGTPRYITCWVALTEAPVVRACVRRIARASPAHRLRI